MIFCPILIFLPKSLRKSEGCDCAPIHPRTRPKVDTGRTPFVLCRRLCHGDTTRAVVLGIPTATFTEKQPLSADATPEATVWSASRPIFRAGGRFGPFVLRGVRFPNRRSKTKTINANPFDWWPATIPRGAIAGDGPPMNVTPRTAVSVLTAVGSIKP